VLVVRNLELLRKNEELEDTFFDLISVEDELKERLEELKEKSRKLEEMSDRYRLISEGTHDVIWDINIANNDLFVSDKMSNILDGDVELSSYKEFSNFLHHDDKEKVISKFRDRIKSGQYYEDEFRLVTKKGDVKHLLCRGKVLRDEDNKPIKMAGSIKNITEKRLYEEKIEELAYTDMLTGLKNRNKCTLDIDKNLNEVRGKLKKNLSVMYIDIDDFKNVNDIYGHPLGDYILKKVSKRLEKLMDEGMELYRFGGDEFLIRMTDYEDIDSVRKKASEILDKISKPFRVNKKEFFLTLSIGIAESKNGKTKFHKMLKKADMALNKAKEEGKNKFRIFTNKLQEESFTNISIESDLKKAISNDELFLVFQPKINIKDNYVDGFEALIRWKHPEKGIVYPGEFIDIAEKSGTIKLIDEWVFKNIIIKTNELEKSGVSFDSISFNVSPSTLLHYSTIENIKAILKENNFKPNKIKIEITENAMIDSINNAKDILNVLKELGFAISLDDFGKGYSSLNYLKMLPIDELKIDKAFIDDIDYSDKDIIDLIINLGHRMGLKIIAEGVENYSQYKYLKDNKCDVIQGYYLAKPLEFDEINLFCEVFH
jgi:diguanylate cyclase (GGDEF)-like protein/PAS domain S-box-containing protein